VPVFSVEAYRDIQVFWDITLYRLVKYRRFEGSQSFYVEHPRVKNLRVQKSKPQGPGIKISGSRSKKISGFRSQKPQGPEAKNLRVQKSKPQGPGIKISGSRSKKTQGPEVKNLRAQKSKTFQDFLNLKVKALLYCRTSVTIDPIRVHNIPEDLISSKTAMITSNLTNEGI